MSDVDKFLSNGRKEVDINSQVEYQSVDRDCPTRNSRQIRSRPGWLITWSKTSRWWSARFQPEFRILSTDHPKVYQSRILCFCWRVLTSSCSDYAYERSFFYLAASFPHLTASLPVSSLILTHKVTKLTTFTGAEDLAPTNRHWQPYIHGRTPQ